MSRALFIDRDGTLVEPRHYPKAPEDLVLYPIAPFLRSLQNAGFLIVVVTNQSGLARGLFTGVELDDMHEHLRWELATKGVTLDGIYHCPHHPDGTVPELSIACSCRKPKPGMILKAAHDLDIDLGRSWFIGDILDDVEAGWRAGCRTVLVDQGTESAPDGIERTPDYIARTSAGALRVILGLEGLGPPADTSYVPPSWTLSNPRQELLLVGSHAG